MAGEKKAQCPVFPEMECPQGEHESQACTVRINGNFDPMVDFRDHLLLHCALYQSQHQNKEKETEE
jgi:protein-arginine kinase